MILPQALPNFSSSTDLRCQCRHPLPRAAQACQPRWLLRCLFSLVPCTWRRVVGFYIHLQLHVTLQSLFQGTSARQIIFYYIRSYYHIILYCIISYHIILDHKDRGSNCLGHHKVILPSQLSSMRLVRQDLHQPCRILCRDSSTEIRQGL